MMVTDLDKFNTNTKMISIQWDFMILSTKKKVIMQFWIQSHIHSDRAKANVLLLIIIYIFFNSCVLKIPACPLQLSRLQLGSWISLKKVYILSSIRMMTPPELLRVKKITPKLQFYLLFTESTIQYVILKIKFSFLEG